MPQMSSPSTSTSPLSGCISPIMCLSVTLFPCPDPPTMTTDSPRSMSIERSRSTGLPPRDFSRWRREMIGWPSEVMVAGLLGCSVAWLLGGTEQPSNPATLQKHLRQKEIRQQNDQRRADHRLRRRAAHPFRPARGVVAAHAAGEREDQSEHGGLDHARPEVL